METNGKRSLVFVGDETELRSFLTLLILLITNEYRSYVKLFNISMNIKLPQIRLFDARYFLLLTIPKIRLILKILFSLKQANNLFFFFPLPIRYRALKNVRASVHHRLIHNARQTSHSYGTFRAHNNQLGRMRSIRDVIDVNRR